MFLHNDKEFKVFAICDYYLQGKTKKYTKKTMHQLRPIFKENL